MANKGIISLLFIFIIFSDLSFGHPKQTLPNKNILVLFSLVPTTPAYRVILDGIRTQLTREYGYSYDLNIEYLETDRHPKDNYPRERFNIYNDKYKNADLDLVICVGIDIVSTLKNYADNHLLSLPNISIDLDFSAYGISTEISLNEQTVEIPLKLHAEKTIATALGLFPDTKSIFIFCGISNGDQLYCAMSKKAANLIDSHKEITFITDTTMNDALRIASQLPDSSLVIISSFTTDNKQVPYNNPESVRLISKAATAPVFTYTDTGFGEGSIGGYMINFGRAGLLAGEIAIKLLKGVEPNAIQVSEKDYYDYRFDWRQIERWKIADSRRIPEGSTILYREVRVFDKYKWFILGGILFLVFQTLLILNLVGLYRRQKVMTQQIIESENKYRELIREDRVLRTGQLMASLSHELNQPLTAILSTAQAGIRFIDSNKATPELMKELLENIVEDDKRTASILSSIRGMMKLEKREKEKVNLNEMIDELILIYSGEAVKRNIKLDASLNPEPVNIVADRTQIQQVIMNFILNAFQAMDKVSQHDRTVSITELTDNEYVTVSVRDKGRGIEDAIMDKIFKPFVTTRKEGTGIGLAISHSIIEDHQGEIWAENMPDGGAKFSFRLKTI